MSDRIIKVQPGKWVKVQHRTSGSPTKQEIINVGADERIIVQRLAYAEPEPPPDPDPPPTGPVRIATAPTNGSDATAGLNADIRATPDGGTLQLVAGASYRVDGTIGQDNRNGLTFDGRGARLYQAAQRSGALIRFEHGGNDIHLRNLVIEGTNINATFSNATEGGHGIAFGGVLRGSVTHCTFTKLWGDGVYIVGGHMADGSFRWADEVTVSDNHIRQVGRMGVACTDGERNIDIVRNDISGCGWYCVDVEPNGISVGGTPLGAAYVIIDDNTFGVVGLHFPGQSVPVVGIVSGGTVPVPMSDFWVRNNRTVGRAFTMYSSSRTRYQRVTISGNHSDTRVSARPLQLNNIDGLLVTGNTQPMSPAGSNMLNAVNCTAVTYTGNDTT